MAGAQSIKSADQIGRLGVMYLRSLLAQAGVAHAETSSGEDHLAVDMTLEFIAGGVRVQIKTGTKATNKDGSLTVPVTEAWKAKWSAAQVPVFLVYVRLEKSTPTEWIEHPDRAPGSARSVQRGEGDDHQRPPRGSRQRRQLP